MSEEKKRAHHQHWSPVTHLLPLVCLRSDVNERENTRKEVASS